MNGSEEDQAPDEDLGEPIRQLSLLSIEPTRGFLDRVRARIERRRLGSHIVGLAWYAPILVFLEFVTMLVAIFRTGTPTEDKEGKPWKK